MRRQRQNFNLNGRTRRKGGLHNRESSGSSTSQNKNESGKFRDPFRNGEFPLCRLLSDAIEDIFPELKDNTISNHGNHPQILPAESGSTLGQMIRRRYLLSRKLIRSSLDEKFKEENIGQVPIIQHAKNNENIHVNGISNTPSTPTAVAKKKRKRKKKKKSETASHLPSTVITNVSEYSFDNATYSSGRNGIASHSNDGKSMMSSADHSLEALDEAVKNEAEKMTQLEAHHEFPLLESLPSDDNIQAQESPSQFIDQIKPQEENLLKCLPDHAQQLPLTDPVENIRAPSSLPLDGVPGKDDYMDNIWRNPLQLPFLVYVENGDELFRCSDDKNHSRLRDGNLPKGLQKSSSCMSDKEKARTLLHEWIDQFFFLNDERKCIGTSATENHQDDSDNQCDEWDSFIQFCNGRTAGTEKALGIPVGDVLEIGSSIECGMCREETLAEIKKIEEKNGPSSRLKTKSSRVVMDSKLLEKPTDNETDIETAFDYVALEEGNLSSNSNNEIDGYDSVDEEEPDSSLSFLLLDAAIDSKQKRPAMKSGSRKKNSTDKVATAEQYFFLQTLTSQQLEQFLSEWLIAGVDEAKLAQRSVRKETKMNERDTDESNSLVVIAESEIKTIKKKTIEIQRSFEESLKNMNAGIEKLRQEWKNKNPTEMNLDFSGMNTLENCEESCNKHFMEDILPILTGEFSIPSHICAELQIHLWVLYLEVLGETLSACDEYYKNLEEDLADQNGKLPLFFISAQLRELYRKFAERKIGLLLEIGRCFSKTASSFSMREFHLRSVWERLNWEGQNKRSEKLDEDCRKLIRALTEWTKIINGGRMSVINRERAKRLEIVFNMLRIVAEPLEEEYKRVEQHFSQECQNYFARLLSNIYLAHGVKNRMRLIEMNDVVSLTTGVILMWRHVRIMQSRADYTNSAKILPLSLRKWVWEAPSTDVELIERNAPKCWPGIGAKRRAMGILAGLTYVWLRERCNEWKAEVASQELLTSFVSDLSTNADQKDVSAIKAIDKAGRPSNKSGKKGKKKKNKNAFVAANGSAYNPLSCSREENEEIRSNDDFLNPLTKPGDKKSAKNDNILVDQSLKSPEQETSDDQQIPIKDNSSDIITVDHGVEIDGDRITFENEEKVKDLVGQESMESEQGDFGESSQDPKEDEDTNMTQESLIVVQDEFGCIVPAMEFLTDRLLALTRQAENEKIFLVPN